MRRAPIDASAHHCAARGPAASTSTAGTSRGRARRSASLIFGRVAASIAANDSNDSRSAFHASRASRILLRSRAASSPAACACPSTTPPNASRTSDCDSRAMTTAAIHSSTGS